jgi:hypothetical protein
LVPTHRRVALAPLATPQPFDKSRRQCKEAPYVAVGTVVHVTRIVSPTFRTVENGDSGFEVWLMMVLPFLTMAVTPVPPTRLTCTAL